MSSSLGSDCAGIPRSAIWAPSTLMRRMGIEALYRKPNTSKRHPQHLIYPYLLRGVAVERANHAWAMDITYIPMARGFAYQVRPEQPQNPHES